jgi:hypothetical protein
MLSPSNSISFLKSSIALITDKSNNGSYYLNIAFILKSGGTLSFTAEEYEQMKVVVSRLAELDAKRELLLPEATQLWMEESCELYSELSRKLRGKKVNVKDIENELHDTLWGLTGLCRLVTEMLNEDELD